MTKRFPHIVLALIPFVLFVLPNWREFIGWINYSRLAFLQAGVVFLAVPLIVGAAVWVSHKLREAEPGTDYV